MSAKAMARLRAEAETVGPMRYCENVYGADLRILLDAHAALEAAHAEALDALQGAERRHLELGGCESPEDECVTCAVLAKAGRR